MKLLKTGLLVATTIFIAACSDSPVATPAAPDGSPAPQTTFALQVVHAVSNAPTVNVNVNGALALAEVDYKESPLPSALEAGTYSLAVDAILPDGSSVLADVITAADVPFEAQNIYTVFAIGNVGDEGDSALQAKIVTRSVAFVPSDTVRVTALHAAAGAPPVNIYLTKPDADLTMEDPINGGTPVAFGDDPLGPLDIAEGDWQIRITAAEVEGEPVVFDTGPVELEGGSDPIVAAVDNTFAGSDSPVSALLVTRLGVAEVFDVATQAELRVTHAVPDVGQPVDVLIDDVVAIPDFNFPNTVYAGLIPGDDYVVQVAVGGNVVINPPTTDEDNNPVDPVSTSIDDGVYYDAIAVGSVAADNLDLAAYADDRRRLATAAKLRLAHLSPSTDPVDIYLVDSAVTDISAVDPSFSEIPYLFNSGYLQVDPGTYNIYITVSPGKDKAISAEGITLDAAGLYTAFARDADTANDETAPNLILLDDFVPNGEL